MLGSLAPDSVYFRDNYDSDMKKLSHLCVGSEKWGEITNNEEWSKNVLNFLQENKNTTDIDFIYGYCAHILTDIQTNAKMCMPFKLANEECLKKGAGNIYAKETYEIDYDLYLHNPQRTSIWKMLENAVGYDIANIVVGNEIDKMKESILHDQFIDREAGDVSLNKYVILTSMQEFISAESQYIKKILYPR
ncbi:hypothetical protein [Desnuesiella massiliensis]|uniref:hypothetical protein n=1 Tax=Desnuesiella massiliensis TaxID=1650662 RepID=UPI0006E31E9D|nr:hypothetical protein [Desnuesiella massiliensis]